MPCHRTAYQSSLMCLSPLPNVYVLLFFIWLILHPSKHSSCNASLRKPFSTPTKPGWGPTLFVSTTAMPASHLTLNPLCWNKLLTHPSSQYLCGVLKTGIMFFIFIFLCLVPSKYTVDVCWMNEWMRFIDFFWHRTIPDPSDLKSIIVFCANWLNIDLLPLLQVWKKDLWKNDVQL